MPKFIHKLFSSSTATRTGSGYGLPSGQFTYPFGRTSENLSSLTGILTLYSSLSSSLFATIRSAENLAFRTVSLPFSLSLLSPFGLGVQLPRNVWTKSVYKLKNSFSLSKESGCWWGRRDLNSGIYRPMVGG